VMRGSVIKYGDNIDTDVIIPARHLTRSDPEYLAAHCMEDLDPDFLRKRKPGDIIVAGKKIGVFGEIHPAVLTAFELEHPVAAFEFDLRAVPGYPVL